MIADIIIPENLHESIRKHLFQGYTEQAAFMFATESFRNGQIELKVDEIYLIPAEAWDVQSFYFLELSQEEKVKIMKMARDLDRHPIECHSHRHSDGPAYFSASDIIGLDEFVQYVRWKLPGKKYGALVWTKSSVYGQVWNDKKSSVPLPATVRIAKSRDGLSKIIPHLDSPCEKILKGLKVFFR